MIDIERAIDLIMLYEGLSLKAYKCPSGKYTIGYGHTKNVKEGDEITKQKALDLLYDDIAAVRKQLDNALNKRGIKLNENQYNALLSFTFNCGISNFNKLVKDRTVNEIGKAILLYNKANGVALRGLTKRRQAEHDLYFLHTRTEIRPSIKDIGFKVKDNYRIRIAPTMLADTIAFTDSTKNPFYKVIGICGEFIRTDKGYIHKDGFYDTFKGGNDV